MPTDMPTGALGRTGLEVTRLGHGAMEICVGRAVVKSATPTPGRS